MVGRIRWALDQWHLRKVHEHWDAGREAASKLDPVELRAMRDEARSVRRKIDRVVHATDQCLLRPLVSAGLPREPLGTDWSWRPDVWSGGISPSGVIGRDQRTRVSDDLMVFHDCPLGEIVLRQLRNSQDSDRAAFGLATELFGFQGSFLSLALRFPNAGVTGLKSRHMIRLDAVIDTDRPVKAYARLNVKHGPNVAQKVAELPQEGRHKVVDFDLAYANITESRVESAWLDLIFNDAAYARITLRDVVVFRCPRAEA